MRRISMCLLGAAVFAGGCAASVKHQASFKPVTIKSDAPEEEQEVEVKPMQVEQDKIEISDKIHFRTKSARLRRVSYPVLDEVVQVMRENPTLVVEIQGHTDSQGRAYRNRRLSRRRAARVQEYLISRGVDARRLSAVGHGEERPIADNDTREGRYENRRVEFIILDETFDEGQLASNDNAAEFDDSDDDDFADDDDDDFEDDDE